MSKQSDKHKVTDTEQSRNKPAKMKGQPKCHTKKNKNTNQLTRCG